MTRASRQPFVEAVEKERDGRTLVAMMNFDRHSIPPVPGLATQLDATVKEPLYRVLKETPQKGIDLFLYTRGGDTNAVWPLVSLVREFDPDFEVLVPFRCHSAGTLFALGARRIVMGRLAELSPIDPTTGNLFNPPDPANPKARLGISVEDVQSYREFLLEQIGIDAAQADVGHRALFQQAFQKILEGVHPLALGNVRRVHRQIQALANNLLRLHEIPQEAPKFVENAVKKLTTEFYSHLHMINRSEAREILGDRVFFAPNALDLALDALLGAYKKDFELWQPYFPAEKLADESSHRCRFIGGVVESTNWSYLFETNVVVRQYSRLPPNMNLQIPINQPLPLLPGFPRNYEADPISQRWVRNEQPLGVDK